MWTDPATESEEMLRGIAICERGLVLRFMTIVVRDVWRLGRVSFVLLVIATICQLNALSQDATTSFHTIVIPQSDENVAKPCEYDLRILNANKRIRALFVVFERGPELQHFYEEPEVAAFAREHDLAMLMPMGCPATESWRRHRRRSKSRARASSVQGIGSIVRRDEAS